MYMLDLADCGDDVYIRDQGENKGSQGDAAAVDNTQVFICMTVNTGESPDRRNFTEKGINDIRPTEREGEGADDMKDSIESPTNPGSGNQFPAEVPTHCDPIEKGPRDGHTVLTGHGCEQEALGSCQGEKQVELDNTLQEGNLLKTQDGMDNDFGHHD